MFQIKEKENILIKQCAVARKEKRKIFIYGSGQNGKMLYHVLKKNQITADGFCVDAAYYKKGMLCCGLPVISFDGLAGGTESVAVVVAFISEEKRDYISQRLIKVIDCDFWSFGSSYNYEENRIDYDFVCRYRDILTNLYENLSDKKSEDCLEAFLNQKISGRFGYLEPLKDENQYYDEEIVDLTGITCIVDCGAYDGDSYRAFCRNYERASGRAFHGKSVLLEPGEEGYSKLLEAYSGQESVVPMNICAWDKKERLCFEEDSTSGRIDGNGSRFIQADSIDNVVLRGGG